MKSRIKIQGLREATKVYRNFPKQIRDKGIKAAAKQALKPVKEDAVRNILADAQFTDGGFSKMAFIAKYATIRTYKNTVSVQIKPSAPDIPVKGSSRPYWALYGFARLYAQGRQWTAKTSTARRRYNTGYTEGFGDWFDKAYQNNRLMVKNVYEQRVKKEIEKAANRAVRKFGYKDLF